MKSELQVQLETALFGELKHLCHLLKDVKVELGSMEMKVYLGVAKQFWIKGTKYVMTELVAQAKRMSLEEVEALTNED